MEQPTYQNDQFEEDHLFIDEKEDIKPARKSLERRGHNPKLGWFICFLLFAIIYLWLPIQIKNIYFGPSSIIEGQVEFEDVHMPSH